MRRGGCGSAEATQAEAAEVDAAEVDAAEVEAAEVARTAGIAWSEDNRLIGWSESFTELCDSIDAQGIEGDSYEYFSGPRRRF